MSKGYGRIQKQILRELHRSKPATIREIIEKSEQELNRPLYESYRRGMVRLEEDGLVKRAGQDRPDYGRPSTLYVASKTK